jgi:hypothetical protein
MLEVSVDISDFLRRTVGNMRWCRRLWAGRWGGHITWCWRELSVAVHAAEVLDQLVHLAFRMGADGGSAVERNGRSNILG